MFVIHTSFKKAKTKRKPGWQQREAEYNEWLKSHGIDPNKKTKASSTGTYKPQPEPYRRQTAHHPSLMTTGGDYSCTKPAPKVYTGTLIKGIATMHKSNAVPVINDQEAKDIATMRRG